MPDAERPHVIWQQSTVKLSLEAAERLLDLGLSQPSERYLPACAALVAASALGQHVDNSLCYAAEMDAAEGQKYSAEQTRPGRVLDEPFMFRVRELVRILSDDQLEMDPRSDITRALGQIVDLRNELMHYSEPALSVTMLGQAETPDGRGEPAFRVTTLGEDKTPHTGTKPLIEVTLKAKAESGATGTTAASESRAMPWVFNLRKRDVFPKNPWHAISLEEAGRLVESVKTYIAVTDEPGTLTAGPFLRARRT